MHRMLKFIFGLILIPVLTIGGNNPADSDFKAGFAEKDITPDIGMEWPGGYGKAYHRTFNDPCKVRAVVFDDGNQRVALVSLDLLLVTRALTNHVRQKIEKACGIPGHSIMISATHNHSAGPIGMGEPGDFDDASPMIKDLVENHSITEDPGFVQYLKKQIIDAVVTADRNKTNVKIAVGVGHEDQVSFNRRLRMKNGLTYSHPRPGNPDIIDYAGPIDPDVGTIGVWDSNDELIGVIVNFANHNTTNPPAISGNWAGAMEETMRKATGNAALPVVCMLGPCGDITQVDNLSEYENPSGEEWRQITGGRVGAEAFKTLLSIRRAASGNVSLDARHEVLQVPRRAPSAEKVKAALQMMEDGPEVAGQTEWTFAKETLLLDHLMKKHPVVEAEIQAIRIGPAVFVSNPAEYFVENGLAIKEASHFPFTFVVELANGCVGYVPTEEAFGPNGGGYETRLTSYSNLEITAGTKFRDVSIRLANEMQPDKVPVPPPAPAFKEAWSYGNVPPEID